MTEEKGAASVNSERFTVYIVDGRGQAFGVDKVQWYYPPEPGKNTQAFDARPMSVDRSEWIISEEPEGPFHVLASKCGPGKGTGCVSFDSFYEAAKILDWKTPKKIVLQGDVHTISVCR